MIAPTWQEQIPERKTPRRRALVLCDCGTEREVDAPMLVAGQSVQCRPCAARARMTKHGLSHTRTYKSWQGMNHRCHVPSDVAWRYYGARGVKVCDRWRAEPYGGEAGAFERFLADMGERPAGRTLDRIDSSGDYEPGNCRWATPLEQTRNRRPRSAR